MQYEWKQKRTQKRNSFVLFTTVSHFKFSAAKNLSNFPLTNLNNFPFPEFSSYKIHLSNYINPNSTLSLSHTHSGKNLHEKSLAKKSRRKVEDSVFILSDKMGKYMRKSKKSGEVSVSPLGVLTRAKTLALSKLVSPAATESGSGGDGGSYLELRSRKLIKPFSVFEGRRQKNGVSKDPNLLNPKIPNVLRTSSEEVKGNSCCGGDVGVEASFGENLLEFEGRKRTTRESTPCSLIRDSDNIQTPGSSTRRINATGRVPNLLRTNIPIAHEVDEFFTRAEEQQRRRFIEKYNFDPVNEKPLPGRYEWVKVDC
uniref:Cyclin-dependent kinase inhibitor 4 isoform X2 n=2 Tax=Nicotiana TaxID=4085 RepID=A0A1S3YDU1_TOBAC|nr:PREDICTED: cyclin-dependent kinase inhibitor 4-like isoform X2 [Nicotiana tabacum]